MNDFNGLLVLEGGIDDLFNEISSKLIPNPFSFVVQLCSLIVLILIVFFVAYKPVKKILKRRAEFIENNIVASQKNKALAEKNLAQSEETILSSKKEASEIINEAKQNALQERQVLEEETKRDIARMKKDAEIDIEKSKEDSLEEIRKEMVSIALVASKEILKREVSEEDNAKLAEDFIEKLN
ncbi:MAG: ATP synthase F0 subunit B [Erysipelotrichaceae bacterium]|jgi:F-type H+-transporting ATPase subunit b|nr:ATP synthase F0 subunit B [Erysipelotrichaceae bacterium]